MKIDIHAHTRKSKSGDANTRDIEADKFVEIIKNTDVKILAITNHNYFDNKQYKEFKERAKGICEIWPGIELDILENEKRSHLIVICNPQNHERFNNVVSEILKEKTPDSFTISIAKVVEKFDSLDCIYVAHYYAKKPNIGDEELQILYGLISNKKRILKEATNSISAGIYISHGHNSIYGSDVHDWNDYIFISKTLPDLRLPVESFEQFCLLLEKDEATINTLLDRKIKDSIEIVPFSVAELIQLDIYNDINILFGSKGTGKTEILEALSKHFNSKGHKTNVYKSNDLHLNDVFDIKGNSFNINASDLGVEECTTEIEFLKGVTEEEVTSLTKYLLHFSVQERNKISQKLKIKNITKIDENQSVRQLSEVKLILDKFKKFNEYLDSSKELKKYVDQVLINELITVLEKIMLELSSNVEINFVESKSVKLLNHIIGVFIIEISKKTGQPAKPTETGFTKYARNRIKVEIAIKKILNNIDIKIEPLNEYAGSLGIKGELLCRTNLIIQNGGFTDSNYSTVKQIKKTPQKEFVKAIISISKRIFSNELFLEIAKLNQIESVETIKSISDLLLKYKHFTIGNEIYNPSNGESSMILLHKELKTEKDIYLIDEPEKSLGNDYINDVIVPLLKEKAQLGKKVVIATHDANIAVRTLPYNSIYRLHDQNQYFTFIGNPFSNSLKCINGTRPELDWKEISMKTLEGGKEAFGERGKIYGN